MGNRSSAGIGLFPLDVPVKGYEGSVTVFALSESTESGNELRVYPDFESGGIVPFKIWPGSRVFSNSLVDFPSDFFRNKKVLELGCGTGFLGLSIAKFSKAKNVVLTDREMLRPVVTASIQANELENCCFTAFDWGDQSHLEIFSETSFDVIVGSELVYAEEQEPLANALDAVMKRPRPEGASPVLVLYYASRSEMDQEYFSEKILMKYKIEKKIGENIFVFSV